MTRRASLACGLVLGAAPLFAQTYDVSFWTIDGGGTAGTSAAVHRIVR